MQSPGAKGRHRSLRWSKAALRQASRKSQVYPSPPSEKYLGSEFESNEHIGMYSGLHIFAELHVFHDGAWHQTHRWNYGLQQHLNAALLGSECSKSGDWSKPHLSTTSVTALKVLREHLRPDLILLDVDATPSCVVDAVLEKLDQTGLLHHKQPGEKRDPKTELLESLLNSPKFVCTYDDLVEGAEDTLAANVDEEAFQILVHDFDLVKHAATCLVRLSTDTKHVATGFEESTSKGLHARFLCFVFGCNTLQGTPLWDQVDPDGNSGPSSLTPSSSSQQQQQQQPGGGVMTMNPLVGGIIGDAPAPSDVVENCGTTCKTLTALALPPGGLLPPLQPGQVPAERMQLPPQMQPPSTPLNPLAKKPLPKKGPLFLPLLTPATRVGIELGAAMAMLMQDDSVVLSAYGSESSEDVMAAFDSCLNELHVVPRMMCPTNRGVRARAKRMLMQMSRESQEDKWLSKQEAIFEHRVSIDGIVLWCQKFAVPLLLGISVALIMANTRERAYDRWAGHGHAEHDDDDGGYFNATTNATMYSHHDDDDDAISHPTIFGLRIHGHDVTLHFIVNDVFMCIFFGLATKEIVEAFQPGGSLHPIHLAINPLAATLGGCFVPVLTYILLILGAYNTGMLSHEFSVGTYLNGWGIPQCRNQVSILRWT